jgi:hypothetical protein
MNEEEKYRILDEARETCARVDRTLREPREPRIEGPNRLDRWRQGIEADEKRMAATRAARQADIEAARATNDARAWSAWVASEIAAAVRQTSSGIAEVLGEELNKVRDELAARDRTISRLEVSLAKTDARLARLELRVIEREAGIDRKPSAVRDIEADSVVELPRFPSRRDVN